MDPEAESDKAYAARITQHLKGPSDALIGFQTLLLEEVRRNGPQEALDDLEKVHASALHLNDMIRSLTAECRSMPQEPEAQSRIRHDLRSPINGIIGYSEMVLEDFADDLTASARHDIDAVLGEVRGLLTAIDTLFDTRDASEDAPDIAEVTALAEGLERALSQTQEAREAFAGTILVIDDEAVNREILIRQLERKGHSVRAVSSAQETFAALAEERFDLALLDILMPDVNGIEILQRIKHEAAWREMPVVMVSGLKESGAIARCISIGAEDYLPKPIDPVLLHARVEACLERARWRAREVEFTNRIQYEKDRADTLLHAMLPAPVIHRLNAGETQIADRFGSATILFADIVDFTPLVARMDAGDLVEALSRLFSSFDELATRHGIEKIKTIGDAYMAASGIPAPREDHATAVVDFARDMIAAMADFGEEHAPLQVRIGVHTGPVIAGVIGKKRSIYDVWGETVNLASRLESSGQAGLIQISEATLAALGARSGKVRPHRHSVKGIGEITSYFLS
jgi:class 3 adenylate cyclase